MPPDHTRAPAAPARALGIAVVTLALLAGSRAPLLLSGRLVPDGDEAILGLMAMRASEGREIPVFFWGQRYGLAAIEAGAAAAAFRAAGVSETSLKAAMLAIWALGGTFMALAARRTAGPRAGWAAAWLLASSPAWGEWSMKARGGYLTAFLFSGALLWLLARGEPAGRRGIALPALAGALAAGIYLAQPLWLAAAIPALVWYFYKRSRWADLPAAAAGAAAILLPALAGASGRDSWNPAIFEGADPAAAAAALPARLLTHLSGAYAFEISRLDRGSWSWWAGIAWLFGGAAALAAALVARERPAWIRSLAAGALLAAGATLAIGASAFGPRYLLPVSGALPVLVGAEAGRFLASPGLRRAAGAGILAAFALLGAPALAEVPSRAAEAGASDPYALSPGDLETLLAEIGYTKARHVYSLDPLLTWNLMFASRGEVRARWLDPLDRRPEIPAAVDAALRAGAPVALVGRAHRLGEVARAAAASGHAGPPPRRVGRRLFLLPAPSPALLRALGFRIRSG
jgi:hypothetical protein